MQRKVKSFDSYSWMDGKKIVKIILDFENALSVDDNNIILVSHPIKYVFEI